MLSYLIEKADEVPDPRLKRWLMLAISSSLRAASKWLVGSIKPQIDPDRTPSPLSESFARAARQLKRDCELEQHKDSPRPLTTIRRGDARNIALPDDSVDAVITSPPYEGMYDYYDVHRLTYLAFGWPQDRDGQIGRTAMIEVDGVGFKPPQPMEGWYLKEFRKEETIEGRVLRDYFDGMEKHLREIRRVVREDAALVYALADTFRRGKRYELVESIAELMKSAGFRYVSVYKRPTSNKRILPSKRNSKTGRFSSSGRVVEVEEALITARG
jgi:DNA modification methylase